MKKDSQFFIECDLGSLERAATDLAVRLADAGRPGHARRMAKIANYAKAMHTMLRIDGSFPPDPPSRDIDTAPSNVRRLKG